MKWKDDGGKEEKKGRRRKRRRRRLRRRGGGKEEEVEEGEKEEGEKEEGAEGGGEEQLETTEEVIIMQMLKTNQPQYTFTILAAIPALTSTLGFPSMWYLSCGGCWAGGVQWMLFTHTLVMLHASSPIVTDRSFNSWPCRKPLP